MYKPHFEDRSIYRIIKYKKRAVSAAFLGLVFQLGLGSSPLLAAVNEGAKTDHTSPGTAATSGSASVPDYTYPIPVATGSTNVTCAADGDQAVLEEINSDVLYAQITSLGLQAASLIAEAAGEALQSNSVTAPAGSAAVVAALALQGIELANQIIILNYEVGLNEASQDIGNLPECATDFAGDVVIYDGNDLYVGDNLYVSDNADIGQNLDVGGVMFNDDANGQGSGVDGVNGGQMLTGIDDNGVHFSSGNRTLEITPDNIVVGEGPTLGAGSDANILVGDNATVNGDKNSLYGSNATVTGDNNETFGSNGTVTGDNNYTNGSGNTILGDVNTTTGNNNFVEGGGNRVTGDDNYLDPTYDNTVIGNSVAIINNASSNVSTNDIVGNWNTIEGFGSGTAV